MDGACMCYKIKELNLYLSMSLTLVHTLMSMA